MDWGKQTEEMLKGWMGTQKKMWDQWLDTLQKVAPQSQANEIWKKTVETWAETVHNALEAQREWIKMWVENIPSVAGQAKEIADWAQQAREMNNRWLDVQQQLWANWFDLIKKNEPKTAGSWDKEGQKMVQAWQESVEKMLEAQHDWASHWTNEHKAEGSATS